MKRRTVLPHVLADPPADEPPEQQRRAEAGDEDGDAGGGEQRDHRDPASLAASDDDNLAVVEVDELVADLLGPLVALAGDEHEAGGVAGSAARARATADRPPAVGLDDELSTPPAAPCPHVGDDLEGVLVARDCPR